MFNNNIKKINPINNQYYSDHYYEKNKEIKHLPFSQPKIRKDVTKLLEKNKIIILDAKTGSGKTTQMPGIIIDRYPNARILVSQPRRNLAQKNAEYVATLLDIKYGNEIGFKYRGTDKTNKSTQILFATDGTVKTMLINGVCDYDFILIDEVHERNISIDYIMYYAKHQAPKNMTFIFMSATMDIKLMKKYFGKAASTKTVEGISKHVTQVFLNEIKSDRELVKTTVTDFIHDSDLHDIYLQHILFILTDICKQKQHTLIFMPKVAHIKKLATFINKNRALFHNPVAIPYYRSDEFGEDYADLVGSETGYKNLSREKLGIMDDEPLNYRIILSTNITESGITLEGLKSVIESGMINSVKFNNKFGWNEERIEFTDKSSAAQRCGRAGRTSNGTCYRAYTKNQYEKYFLDYPYPQILSSNIDNDLIELYFSHEEDFNGLSKQFITPFPKDAIRRAKEYIEYFYITATNWA
jgi:pre-mRNA-splicing factor ATP-dependent RNA helicase DHX15/PRP43